MSWRDLTNAAFEMSGVVFVGLNCLDIWRKKFVAGQTLTAISFFTAWGVWNVFFYPSLGQWCSTIGALGVLSANAVLIALILRYRTAPLPEADVFMAQAAAAKKRYPTKRKVVPLSKKVATAFADMALAVRAAAEPFMGGIPFAVPMDTLYTMPVGSADIDRVLAGERLSEGRTEIHHRLVWKDGTIAHELSWEDKPAAKKKGKSK